MSDYIHAAGQTMIPAVKNTDAKELPFEMLKKAHGDYPKLELAKKFEEKGYKLVSECSHFLPGVTAKMLDWWWCNLEKGYYLWAPGAHKRFMWEKAPCQYGFLNSAHRISEVYVPGKGVFGGDEGITIERIPLDEYFTLTFSMKHVICEGIFNEEGQFVDETIHMWEDVDGGCNHIMAAVVNTACTNPPKIMLSDLNALPTGEERAIHGEYEASRWPDFLPALYDLWKDHPDPSQNVFYDLTVEEGADGVIRYASKDMR